MRVARKGEYDSKQKGKSNVLRGNNASQKGEPREISRGYQPRRQHEDCHYTQFRPPPGEKHEERKEQQRRGKPDGKECRNDTKGEAGRKDGKREQNR